MMSRTWMSATPSTPSSIGERIAFDDPAQRGFAQVLDDLAAILRFAGHRARQLAQPSAAGADVRVLFLVLFFASWRSCVRVPDPESFEHGDLAALHAQPFTRARPRGRNRPGAARRAPPCAPNAPRAACHRAIASRRTTCAQITRSPSGSAIVLAACHASICTGRRKRQHVGGLVLAAPELVQLAALARSDDAHRDLTAFTAAAQRRRGPAGSCASAPAPRRA